MEFLNLKGGYTGLSESTIVKMPHCWKSHENICKQEKQTRKVLTDGKRVMVTMAVSKDCFSSPKSNQ